MPNDEPSTMPEGVSFVPACLADLERIVVEHVNRRYGQMPLADLLEHADRVQNELPEFAVSLIPDDLATLAKLAAEEPSLAQPCEDLGNFEDERQSLSAIVSNNIAKRLGFLMWQAWHDCVGRASWEHRWPSRAFPESIEDLRQLVREATRIECTKPEFDEDASDLLTLVATHAVPNSRLFLLSIAAQSPGLFEQSPRELLESAPDGQVRAHDVVAARLFEHLLRCAYEEYAVVRIEESK